MNLLRLPKAPRLDMEAGANPFGWILVAAKNHREERQVALDQHRRDRRAQNRALDQPVTPSK